MNQDIDFYVPGKREFQRGCKEYEREVRKDAYFSAVERINKGWNNPAEMAAGVEILVKRWNSRLSGYNRDDVVKCIQRNLPALRKFRKRNILSLSDNDSGPMRDIFNEFLDALKIYRNKTGYVKSPVSTAKALHPLVPDFFPLWDQAISEAYRCGYSGYGPENAANIYFRFCKKMKAFAEVAKGYVPKNDDRSLLKRIDEYNYAKFTYLWI